MQESWFLGTSKNGRVSGFILFRQWRHPFLAKCVIYIVSTVSLTAETKKTLYHSSYLFSTWYQCFVFLLKDNKKVIYIYYYCLGMMLCGVGYKLPIYVHDSNTGRGVQLKLWGWAIRVSIQSSNKTLVTVTHESKYHSGYNACATAWYENPKTQWEKRERISQPNEGAVNLWGL